MVKERRAKAIFDCTGDDELELTFKEGDIILNVEETAEEGWLRGKIERTGEQGLFPDNYVELFEVEKSTLVNSAKPVVGAVPTKTAVAVSTTPKPILPGRKVTVPSTLGGAGRAAPSQLAGGVKIAPSPALPSRSSDTAASGVPPPSLPQRNNTLKTNAASEESNDATPSAAPASIRERMANLSATATLNQQHTPAASGLGLHTSGAKPNGPARAGVPVLPTRSNAAFLAKESPASSTTKFTAAPSPLSSVARPALPPRTSTGSSIGSSAIKLPTSSSTTSTPRSFQVEGAEAPAPKLTTFSRPRAARSTKATSSPTSLSEDKTKPLSPLTTSPKSISSVASAPSSTAKVSSVGAPKLPARSATSTSLLTAATTASSSSSSSGSAGPIRFATKHQDSERDTGGGGAGPSPPNVVAALPAISRNAQPLPLPSRPDVATASTTTGATATAVSTPAPPLPARSNTIGTGDGAGRTLAGAASGTSTVAATVATATAAEALPERSGSARQSPGFKYQPVASQQYLKHGGSQVNLASSALQNEFAASTTKSESPSTAPSMPGALQVGRPTLYKGGQRLNGSNSSLGGDHAVGGGGANNKASWAPKSLGATGRSLNIGGGAAGGPALAGRPTPSPPPLPVVGIRPDALKRYEALFESKVGTNVFMDAVQVYAIYVRSRLDSKTLAQIWDLVDVSSRGALTKTQFCMGLYLIDERLGSGVIPLEVSPELWASAR
ncbi:Increased rDNA silencing protein [Actinomortierella ambigua]|uniref:Increased rDNA silencing protein n=1 Tax=Actinomortierella ambigua TaxID=1343610 RepID=A0A9P6TWF8_9FUNG|nr:Increased rDNA silencing protein [Actinomortierella ambigua]